MWAWCGHDVGVAYESWVRRVWVWGGCGVDVGWVWHMSRG